LFGSLPFTIVAWIVTLEPGLGAPDLTPTLAAFRNPLNGFFESMSGFTGTGLTMTDNEAVLPATLQWWRSLTEWVGGVGVIVLTTAVLARPGSGSLTLYESEARSGRIHPSIVSTVRTIWWISLLFTFLSIALPWLVGMPLWDAINRAMTGLATGGFSITDDSIATYDSALIDAALLPIMVLGSIAFPIHYLILQGEVRNLYADLQTRWVFGFFAAGTVGLIAALLAGGTYGTAFAAVRYGAFQFVSGASCAGFQTASDLGTAWPPIAQLIVSIGMVVGAAAGSTVGGIKLVRAITLFKGTTYRIRGVFYPERTIRRFHIGDRKLTDDEASREFEEAAVIAFLWVVFLLAGVFVLRAVAPGEFTLENVIFEVASAQGNVGLSAGITGAGCRRSRKSCSFSICGSAASRSSRFSFSSVGSSGGSISTDEPRRSPSGKRGPRGDPRFKCPIAGRRARSGVRRAHRRWTVADRTRRAGRPHERHSRARGALDRIVRRIRALQWDSGRGIVSHRC
jgi:trk system potassium uptake protein TrkH